jgi:hypothetical protein
MAQKTWRLLAIGAVIVVVAGCRGMYYSAMETFGKEKRHILKSRIESVAAEEDKAAEEFKDALTRLKEMYGFDGAELEKVYRKLQSDHESCSSLARSVRKRIDDMQTVAGDLFKEWEKELAEISNADLRAKSEESLRKTRERFANLDSAVNRAADRMDPVLTQLNDYVLYLKHNLNAQAVGALKIEADKIEEQVNVLVDDIQKSVAEAEQFLAAFEKQ